MPEGPECKRVGEGLLAASKDRPIENFRVLGGRFLKKSPMHELSPQVPNRVIDGGVYGKFIWLELMNQEFLWITLGMSGFWSEERLPHSHFSIDFEDGGSLYFVDQRRFGTLKFVKGHDKLVKKISSLGIDPLDISSFNVHDAFNHLNKAKSRTIAEALMDQRIFAGVGNYIKCEVLYRARISPYRLVKDLTDSEICKIWDLTRLIMRSSYEQGGASIRNYRQVNGDSGDFVFEFEVYAQKQDPLGNLVVREETLDGRTTHWVPELQS